MNGVLEQLENINIERGKYFPDYHYYENKDLAYYGNAAAGEMGECCNKIKKHLRGDIDASPLEIAKEAADVIIYLEFLTSMLGLSLSECLRMKFNEVSKNIGSDLFINKVKF